MAIEEIRNFVPVGERIGTAGQPTEAQLRDVVARGYDAVLNIGLLDPKYCLPDEAGLTAALGLQYRHVPVKFDAPTIDDFRAFLAVMDEWAGRRVFIHCAANYRVSAFMALYGEMRLGWTREQADSHARKIWAPNETWEKFLGESRSALVDQRRQG